MFTYFPTYVIRESMFSNESLVESDNFASGKKSNSLL
jgi:hypothetical protein